MGQHLRNALFDALHQLSGTHYRKLFSVVTLLQFLSLGLRHSSSLRLSFLSLLTNTLPGPSASEVTTLWRYTNLFIIIIIIIIMSGGGGVYVDIVNRVRGGECPPFRPQLPAYTYSHGGQQAGDDWRARLDYHRLVALVEDCWAQDPATRPTIAVVRSRFNAVNSGKHVHVTFTHSKVLLRPPDPIAIRYSQGPL